MQRSRETRRACMMAVAFPVGLGLYNREVAKPRSISRNVETQPEPLARAWGAVENSVDKKFPLLKEKLLDIASRGVPIIDTPCNDDEHVMASKVGGRAIEEYFGPLRGNGVLTHAEQKMLRKLRKNFPLQRQDSELLRHGLLQNNEGSPEHIRVIASNHGNSNQGSVGTHAVRRAGTDVPVGLHLPTGQMPVTPGWNKEDKEWQRCRKSLEHRLMQAAKANPLLPRYMRNKGDGGAAASIEGNMESFYAELAEDATRISRLYLGLDKMHGVNFGWEAHPAAHASHLTGETVQLFTAPTPTVLPGDLPGKVIRSQGVIAAPKEAVFELMLNDSRSHEYDKYVAGYTILRHDIESRQFIRHYRYRSVWPTAPRDLVALSTFTENSDGSILISTISLPLNGGFSVECDGYLRAQIVSSCSLIKPLGNGDRCELTFISHVDPGGYIPPSISNILGPANCQDTLRNARDLLERDEARRHQDA